MAGLSTFSLQPTHRGPLVVDEILINGRPLAAHIARHEQTRIDHVSPLAWNEEARARLALSAPPDLPGGRTSILICSECGSLSCGAVSAIVTREGEVVAWSELGIANDLEIEDQGPWLFEKVRGFKFSWAEYRNALRV